MFTELNISSMLCRKTLKHNFSQGKSCLSVKKQKLFIPSRTKQLYEVKKEKNAPSVTNCEKKIIHQKT